MSVSLSEAPLHVTPPQPLCPLSSLRASLRTAASFGFLPTLVMVLVTVTKHLTEETGFILTHDLWQRSWGTVTQGHWEHVAEPKTGRVSNGTLPRVHPSHLLPPAMSARLRVLQPPKSAPPHRGQGFKQRHFRLKPAELWSDLKTPYKLVRNFVPSHDFSATGDFHGSFQEMLLGGWLL